MVVLEAMASRVPVVTFDGDLWPDDVRAQLVMVDPGDAAQLGRTLATAGELHHPQLPPRFEAAHSTEQWLNLISEAAELEFTE